MDGDLHYIWLYAPMLFKNPAGNPIAGAERPNERNVE